MCSGGVAPLKLSDKLSPVHFRNACAITAQRTWRNPVALAQASVALEDLTDSGAPGYLVVGCQLGEETAAELVEFCILHLETKCSLFKVRVGIN